MFSTSLLYNELDPWSYIATVVAVAIEWTRTTVDGNDDLPMSQSKGLICVKNVNCLLDL